MLKEADDFECDFIFDFGHIVFIQVKAHLNELGYSEIPDHVLSDFTRGDLLNESAL